MKRPTSSPSIAEFNDFVWNHAQDEFQAKFDLCAPLSEQETIALVRLLADENVSSLRRLERELHRFVRDESTHLLRLLQITGLTRNKIIQDIKAFARTNGLKISFSSPAALLGSADGRRLAVEYLARQVRRVFLPATGSMSAPLLETINQATWPGYIRQERAKRQGHEAEYRLACALRSCGIPFQPEAKSSNPLCPDAQLHGESFDLVIPAVINPVLVVKSTVHTANIGQYGESKDKLEMQEARKALERIPRNRRPLLLAFIDGVGFESNRTGLEGALNEADEFCQFRTLWKAVALAGRLLNHRVVVALPSADVDRFRPFCDRYDIGLLDLTMESNQTWPEIGDARVLVAK